MSDERPIEEIIGWRNVTPSNATPQWMAAPGDFRTHAEADDLAAWLYPRGGTILAALDAAVRKVAGQ